MHTTLQIAPNYDENEISESILYISTTVEAP